MVAMVAKVELKAIAPSTRRLEPLDTHSAVAQDSQPTPRQTVAANLIVEKVYLHACPRPLHQPILKFFAQRVVTHDVKLHEEVVSRQVDRRKDGVKSRVTIHEQFNVIGGGGRKRSQHFAPPSQSINRPGLGGERLDGGSRLLGGGVQRPISIRRGAAVADKLRAPKNPIEWNREIRKCHERQRPAKSRLRRAHLERRVDGIEHSQPVHEPELDSEKRAPIFGPHSFPCNVTGCDENNSDPS